MDRDRLSIVHTKLRINLLCPVNTGHYGHVKSIDFLLWFTPSEKEREWKRKSSHLALLLGYSWYILCDNFALLAEEYDEG